MKAFSVCWFQTVGLGGERSARQLVLADVYTWEAKEAGALVNVVAAGLTLVGGNIGIFVSFVPAVWTREWRRLEYKSPCLDAVGIGASKETNTQCFLGHKTVLGSCVDTDQRKEWGIHHCCVCCVGMGVTK